MTTKKNTAGLLLGGLLPVIAFTVIEEYYGIIPGLIAGMIFGGGEIIFELYKYKKVQKITWIGNGMLLILGAVSLISSEGIWFKLQPALFEIGFALALWFSIFAKRPLLTYLAEQQGQVFPEKVKNLLTGVTFRMGFFFAFHSGLATWAAFEWSTRNWALLKGVGLTLSFIVYLVCEGLFLRRTILRKS